MVSANQQSMKHTILKTSAAAVLAAALTCSAFAQVAVPDTETTTTITSAGTISQFNPDAIVVQTEGAPLPVRYTYTKATTYVDENGNPVSIETVKSGLPVTVYYIRQGDQLIASKVIVRKEITPPTTSVEETKSTTTTTTTK